MQATERRVTYTELLRRPDDGRQRELYDGEVVVVPSPYFRHQRVAAHIAELLREYEKAAGGVVVLAPFDIVLSEYDVLQPDVVYFKPERRELLDDWDVARVAPDLAVEVVSDSTETRDRGRKMRLLERFGVPEYWIVDPVGNVLEVYALRGESYALDAHVRHSGIVTSPTLPGLSFDASRPFEA